MVAVLGKDLHEQIMSIFERLHISLGTIVAVGLGDGNGLPVAFVGPTQEKEAAVAMASLLVGAARRASEALRLPHVQDIVVDAEDFTMMVHSLGERFTLITIFHNQENLGYARLVLQTCSDDLAIALEDY